MVVKRPTEQLLELPSVGCIHVAMICMGCLTNQHPCASRYDHSHGAAGGFMSLADARALSVLTIAGSDSGGGAGIQADLKTFAAHGLHGLSAIAALTAQHTRGVTAVHVPPVDFLRAQIDACFDDFRIGAVKLGMLANKQVIDAVADYVHGALRHAIRPGRGEVAVLNHFWQVVRHAIATASPCLAMTAY